MRLALEDAVKASARGGSLLILPELARHDLAIMAQANAALAEYRLVSQGVTTYERLGYDTGNGPAEHKMIEYLVIDGLIAEQQRRQRGKN